jgi:hypothetical protein
MDIEAAILPRDMGLSDYFAKELYLTVSLRRTFALRPCTFIYHIEDYIEMLIPCSRTSYSIVTSQPQPTGQAAIGQATIGQAVRHSHSNS